MHIKLQDHGRPGPQVQDPVNLPPPPASDLRSKAMASPQSHLLELLRFPGVSGETNTVLTTLLKRCANDHELSAYVLECVNENLRMHDGQFNLSILGEQESCAHCMLLRAHLVEAVADALNSEAARWMSDFLLVAIGKRKHQHRMRASHPLVHEEFPEKCLPARRDLEETQEMTVRLRDGSKCSISGSTHSVVCSQLIPISDDIERLVRFRVLASMFFQVDIPSLSDAQLRSTENALLLSLYWNDRLDRGQLVFQCIDDEFHATLISRDDSDSLAEERQSNGLQGPTVLELHAGTLADAYPRLSPLLAMVHRAIIETWLDTGLADRLLDDIDWVETLPKGSQSMSRLGPQTFSSVLQHKLMLI